MAVSGCQLAVNIFLTFTQKVPEENRLTVYTLAELTLSEKWHLILVNFNEENVTFSSVKNRSILTFHYKT